MDKKIIISKRQGEGIINPYFYWLLPSDETSHILRVFSLDINSVVAAPLIIQNRLMLLCWNTRLPESKTPPPNDQKLSSYMTLSQGSSAHSEGVKTLNLLGSAEFHIRQILFFCSCCSKSQEKAWIGVLYHKYNVAEISEQLVAVGVSIDKLWPGIRASSYPWSFPPARACQIPPLKLCPLKTLLQVVLTPSTTQSMGLDWDPDHWIWTAFLCAGVAFSDQEFSSPGSRWH
ncbi:hypothetical protein HGM15179_003028 [Zosterops borbonicus]|uniref:Uncharacterized protein n=1 Tax=Zosterops borbonicus TaxID=364589 RepID=A0A8K1LRH7_9PASS|nr:hypothetical protein HGM15179_003028 [Zosterops borbonicus]